MSEPSILLALCALSAAALTGCGDSTTPVPVDAAVAIDCPNTLPDDAGVAPTFMAVQSLFMRRCAVGSVCHGMGGQGDLALLGPTLYADLVRHPSQGVPSMARVEPGHPERSYLWLKMTGCFRQIPACAGDAGACGDPMPTLSPISEGFALSEATVLRAWILAGAPQ